MHNLFPPLLFIVAALICGILAIHNYLFFLGGFFIICWGALLHAHYQSLIIFLGFACFGWGYVSTEWKLYSFTQVKKQYLEQPYPIIGTIIEAIHDNDQCTITIQNEATQFKNKSIRALISCSHDYLVGKKIIIPSIVLRRLYQETNDFILLRDSIIAFIKPRNYEIQSQSVPILKKLLLFPAKIREYIHLKARAELSPNAASLFNSLFLGIPQKMYNFRNYANRWGIVHYLARSGLHISLLFFLWTLALRYIPLLFWQRIVLLLLILLIYHLCSFSSVSFNRAALGCFVTQIILLKALPTHAPSSVSTACLIVLLVNPFNLYFLSFQLSFFLAFSLAWTYEYKKTKQIAINNFFY